ncbi:MULTISPECIES: patatin-like phospholipase family protein [Anaerofustis]|uniref:patatin-like phospholipase family protein n=1 Tax=Anaerofustis TaxID=264995 RepID=UPI001106137E|nr:MULTISPECIES: patatin-like phospholipase family protein [Anaerofustis]MCO8193254.1 patatin-like phospholipase family protein [Anaerofustis sp. NSJ-163]
MKFDINKEYALALSGGGVRGAYQIGVWRALIEEGIKIKAVCGTSIGAINGALIAQDDFDMALKLWSELTPDIVYNKESNVIDRIRDISKLETLLKDNLDEEKIRNSDIDFGLVTFNLTTKEPVIIFKDEIPEGKMADYILASANYPVFYRKEIDEEIYVDGGIYDNLPRKPLADKGYKDIIEVDINPPLSDITKKNVCDDVNIYNITSKHSLHGQFIFNQKQLNDNLSKGYLDVKLYNDEFLSSHFYVKKPTNNYDISLKPKDIARLILDDRFIGIFLNNKIVRNCIIYINDYYKSKNGYDDGDLSIRDERFFMAAMEITAEVLDVEPIMLYSYEEFRVCVVREIYKLISKEEVITDLIKNGPFNSKNDLKDYFDKKTILALLIFLSYKNQTLEKIIYKISPKILISFITSFIVMNRLNFDLVIED